MVGFLHDRAGKFFTINASSGPFDIHGKPKNLLVDQGHTSNGAAGTAVILMGLGGFLTLWLEKRRGCHSALFIFWVVMTWLSATLTLSALIYVNVVVAQTDNQSIELSVAEVHPDPQRYPVDKWTPDNWFKALLALPLAHDGDRGTLRYHLRLTSGWRWNLIPLFIVGAAVALLATSELVRERRWTTGESREKLRHSGQSGDTYGRA
ncbi:hypothetical protein LTR47_011539 [Exophiala xenobiotica]|nr:hypothetical protein LTR47_011539 [Exophiala xenobiotica]KAK5262082.1 hypothetical protein LTR40_001012 [Exophiala xenobiotica]KAK5344821.1 hypothetical protein LTR61_011409 [Exophiala xenobiotica]KAK5357225.1 hypothetical protein LTR11_011530 [Exophiala xenobiotica]KAK5358123.1 hypothetical protein LTS03_011356 [Exophiala xenobiotica]